MNTTHNICFKKKTLLRLRAIAMEVKFFQQRKLKESKKGEKGKGVNGRHEERRKGR